MKIIANGINGNYLDNDLNNAPKEIEWVKAAVAYASNFAEEKLIKFCRDRAIPLTFYGRMDYSCPVSIDVLKRFLQLGPLYTCKLVENFHPKVLWFEGYGAYIGSANLTNLGWYNNIELGTWFINDDLLKFNFIEELENFFSKVEEESNPLTKELLNKIQSCENISKEFYKEKQKLEETFRKIVSPTLSRNFKGLTMVSQRDTEKKQKEKFLEEWNSTLTQLRQISREIIKDENRPKWVKAEVPSGVQIDQFLHAFYYNQVKPGNKSQHENFHEKNKKNPMVALRKTMEWWSSQEQSNFEDEYKMMYYTSPLIKDKLSSEKILSLSESEFVEVLSKVYAFRTAARQTPNKELNLDDKTHLNIDERAKKVAQWLYQQKNSKGMGPKEILNYTLHKGSIDDIPQRIWEVIFIEEWHLSRFGLSTIGEIVGWVMPNDFPPRNGRTSKALYALGFNVKIHVN